MFFPEGWYYWRGNRRENATVILAANSQLILACPQIRVRKCTQNMSKMQKKPRKTRFELQTKSVFFIFSKIIMTTPEKTIDTHTKKKSE